MNISNDDLGLNHHLRYIANGPNHGVPKRPQLIVQFLFYDTCLPSYCPYNQHQNLLEYIHSPSSADATRQAKKKKERKKKIKYDTAIYIQFLPNEHTAST